MGVTSFDVILSLYDCYSGRQKMNLLINCIGSFENFMW